MLFLRSAGHICHGTVFVSVPLSDADGGGTPVFESLFGKILCPFIKFL